MKIFARLQWISSECGGRTFPPFEGMRPMIRWQRHIDEYLKGAWDVTVLKFDMDEKNRIGTAELIFIKEAVIPPEWLQEGELLELLDGFRVIAVGKIIIP